MWYLYIVECRDGSLYTGVTTDIKARLAKHNAGKGSRYVRSKLPIKLVYFESCQNKSNAHKNETRIKRLTHQEKSALVRGELKLERNRS